MPAIKKTTTIREYQNFIRDVYGLPNERHFSLWDMLSNVERFTMRGLKGIRKEDHKKAKYNLLISLSWFISILNRLHIDLEDAVWNRFPYLCSYCASCPCSCKEKYVKTRQKVHIDDSKKPSSLREFQTMFENIYLPHKRTIEHAGIHLAEELGEFSEAILAYRGEHNEDFFKEIVSESADVFSCIIGVFNSLNIDLAEELSDIFYNNCHTCNKSPCECSFTSILRFES